MNKEKRLDHNLNTVEHRANAMKEAKAVIEKKYGVKLEDLK